MKRIIILCLIGILLLSCLCACGGQKSAVESDVDMADDLYAPATQDLTVSLHHTKQMLLDDQVYLQSCSQTQTYRDDRIQVLQTVSFNGPRQTLDLLYDDGYAYLFMDEAAFRQEMTQENFIASYGVLPSIEAKLYKQVESSFGSEESILFHFYDSTEAEAWALPAGAKFVKSDAYVQANDFQISMIVYNIHYQVERIEYAEQYLLVYHPECEEITRTPNQNAVLLRDLRIPLILEEASSYLLQNTQVSAVIHKEATSQVTGTVLELETQLSRSGAGADLIADVVTTMTTTDPSRGGTAVSTVQQEHYEKQTYTITTDSGSEKENVSPDAMSDYCNNQLLACILLPQYIQDATLLEEGNFITIEFVVASELEQPVLSWAYSALYQDPALSQQLLDAMVANSFTAWLKVSKTTGLPVDAGIRYEGSHVLPESNYAFASQSQIQYKYQ